MEREGQKKVLTEGEEIQNVIIDHNIKHFSEAEHTPLGKRTFLYEAIGPHGTSEFCDRVLEGGLGEADRDSVNFAEAYELLQHMQLRKSPPIRRIPYQWITDAINEILAPNTPKEEEDIDSDTEDEPMVVDPKTPWDDPPDRQPEISLNLDREELRRGFKLWDESIATSPSGRHLGYYKVLLQDDSLADFFLQQMELPLQFGFSQKR